jgi:hypothetical protein
MVNGFSFIGFCLTGLGFDKLGFVFNSSKNEPISLFGSFLTGFNDFPSLIAFNKSSVEFVFSSGLDCSKIIEPLGGFSTTEGKGGAGGTLEGKGGAGGTLEGKGGAGGTNEGGKGGAGGTNEGGKGGAGGTFEGDEAGARGTPEKEGKIFVSTGAGGETTKLGVSILFSVSSLACFMASSIKSFVCFTSF